MRSEILNVKDPAIVGDDIDEITDLIFEGAKRELKFRQAAMISHKIAVEENTRYLESSVDFFARGKIFVLIAFAIMLVIIFFAIYQSTDDWSVRISQYKSIALLIVFSIPFGYFYLNIEKRIRHHRLHKKIESKLKELIFTKAKSPSVQ